MMIELVLLTSLVTFLLYMYNEFRAFYYIKPPVVHSKKSDLHQYVTENCQAMQKPFIPTFWAFNNHLQTWLKTFCRFHHQNQLDMVYTREYLEMSDTGIISLDWVTVKEFRKSSRRKSVRIKTNQSEKPILLIIPSAINTRVEDYTFLCLKAIKNGFKPLFFNRRGYSQTPLTTPKVTTYCDKSDLVETLNYLNNQFPFSTIYAVAYSMESGNLISYLGQEQEYSLISAAVCVSSTFGCENLLNDHGLKEPYNSIITEKLKTMLHGEEVLEEMSTAEEIDNCRNLVELQDQIHARCNSYLTLAQYLQYNNPLSHLNRIQVPILFIHSKDDPVVPEHSVPFQYFDISEYGLLVTTEYGGHCGFFQDTAAIRSWSDELCVDFLKLISKQHSKVMIKRYNRAKANGTMRSRSLTVL